MTALTAFDQYHQAVYSFAYRLTGSAVIAEDVAQECFLALIRDPQRYDPKRGTLKVFLFGIARNLALKQYRDQREESVEDFGNSFSFDPQRNLELSTAVASAIATLSPLQQEVLILFEYEGATLEEIALIVGADIGTVKSRLHRGRERLRKLLAPYRKVENAHGTN
jgi:RNA polymerase sigma-70 factor, ECF subfamily